MTGRDLFGDPEGGDYHGSVWGPFGKTISPPEPFGVEVETAESV